MVNGVKTTIMWIFVLLCWVADSRQEMIGLQSQEFGAEQTVSTLLADDGHAPIVGFVETMVGRLGDGAAVGVIQYIGERKDSVSEDSVSPEEIRRILDILRMSFAAPQIIEAPQNRSPKATLVLLKYLSALPAARGAKADLD